MRIALATETFLPHIDGIVTRLTETIKFLRRFGDELLILTPDRPGLPTEYEGSRVLGITSRAWPQYPDIYLAVPWLTTEVTLSLREFQPDLIHAACPAFLGTGVVEYAHRNHLPLVGSYHVQYAEYIRRYRMEPFVPFVWWYLRHLHNQAQLNLATSTQMVRELRERGFAHMKLWQAGVDAERFHPAKRDPAMRLRLSDGHPEDLLLIVVARLAREKMIDQIAPVLRALPGTRLAIVGDGPARGSLEETFAGLPVHFAGMLRGEELAQAYATADAFILPSTTETLGLVALEAMAAGIPALVADAGGLPDLVVPGETGFLVPPEHAAGFIDAARALRDDPALLRRMSDAARAHASTFQWEETARQLRTYYAHVLDRWPQPAAEDFSTSPMVDIQPADVSSSEMART